MDIKQLITEKAKEKMNRILLVEGEDERVIQAASISRDNGICYPVLLGNKESITTIAEKKNISLNGIEILDYTADPNIENYAEKLAELRKHKGLTVEKARELLAQPTYFGALMVQLGVVDGAVGGCKFSTAEWMRPVFQIIGTKEGVKTVSAVSAITMRDKTYFLTDTDFNIVPDKDQLAEIAVNAARFVKGFGIEPKVAFLSYSTKGSGEHPSLAHIREALDIAKETEPTILFDGELQVDAAINPDAAQKKCPDSPLKGDANVFVFPDITVGNVLIHSLIQWTDTPLYGSFPVGLAKPVVNGGRSLNPQQIADLIVSCAMEVNLE